MADESGGETARAAEELRERIIDGQLPGGRRLVERALAEELGVSRLPVRHALKLLAGEGLVDHRAGGGFCVHSITLRDVADLAELLPAFDVLANRQAALRRTPRDLTVLRRAADACIDAVRSGDGAAVHAAGLALRREVYRVSRNRALIDVNRALDSRLRRLVLPVADQERSIALYEETYRGIEAADPDAAASALERFLAAFRSANRERILDAMENDGSANPTMSMPPIARDAPATPEELGRAASGAESEAARVLSRVREQIIRGARRPGDPLSERQLSTEFSVSRIPVSEAINALVAEGLAIPGTARAVARVRGLTRQESEDLVEVSSALAAAAIRLAAQRASASDIARLEELVRTQETLLEERGCSALADSLFEFRRRLHEMAANPLVLVADSIITPRLRLLASTVQLDETPLRAERLAIDALTTRDSALADAIVRNFAAGPARRILETQKPPN